MNGIRAVLFDVDGVLLDTDDALVRVFSHTLAVFGLTPPSPSEILRGSGSNGDSWLRKLVPRRLHRLVPGMHAVASQYYLKTALPRWGKLNPGVLETLDALRARGIKTGVVTNMPRAVADKAFAYFQLKDRFDFVVTPEVARGIKPSAQPLLAALRLLRLPASSVLFVGDTSVDQRSARAAGVPFVLVHHARNADLKAERVRALSGLLARVTN